MLLNKSKLLYALFDWDGTLADNRAIVIKTINQVLANYGLGKWEDICKQRNPKLSFRDNFVNFFGENAQVAYEQYVQFYKINSPQMIKGFPFAEDVIRYFNEQGVEVIVMTNKDRRLLDIEMPLLYNPSLFLRVVCGHEAPKDKPYPEHIYYSLRGLLSPTEINQQNVWMIGDSSQDSDCAISAGATPIRLHKNLFNEQQESSQLIQYFESFAEFYNFLAKY